MRLIVVHLSGKRISSTNTQLHLLKSTLRVTLRVMTSIIQCQHGSFRKITSLLLSLVKTLLTMLNCRTICIESAKSLAQRTVRRPLSKENLFPFNKSPLVVTHITPKKSTLSSHNEQKFLLKQNSSPSSASHTQSDFRKLSTRVLRQIEINYS